MSGFFVNDRKAFGRVVSVDPPTETQKEVKVNPFDTHPCCMWCAIEVPYDLAFPKINPIPTGEK